MIPNHCFLTDLDHVTVIVKSMRSMTTFPPNVSHIPAFRNSTQSGYNGMNSRRKRIIIRRDKTLGQQLVCILQVELPMKNLPESLQRKFSDNYESCFFVLYCYVIFMGKKVL